MEKLFFDTEFTGLHKEAELISIGIVDNEDNTFYAEINDFNMGAIANNPWIIDNVIANLIFNDEFEVVNEESKSISMKGTKSQVSNQLLKWIGDRRVEFVSDCNSYDHVLLVDLLTGGRSALEVPNNISPYCHDINQDIARYYKVDNKKAFNMNREELADTKADAKHNALKDAIDIKNIYEMINGGK